MAGLIVESRLRTTDFLAKLLHGRFLFALRVFVRNLLRGNRRRNTFRILFWCLAWGSNPDFSSNKPTHYLLHYCDIQSTYSRQQVLVRQYIVLRFYLSKMFRNQVRHQSVNMKIFLRRLSLSRFLVKTLRVNKKLPWKFSQKICQSEFTL